MASRYLNGRGRVFFYTKPKYGHYLFKHLRAMAQQPQLYQPPPYFDAMKNSPPPPGPFRTTHRGRIIFPGDKYYAQIEKKSMFIRKLNKIGINPVPWWFTRRPAEEAIARIQELMEKNQWGLDKAIFEFDKEFAEKQKVKELEIELMKEQAAAQGAFITPLDVFRVLQVIKDEKVKSDEIIKHRLKSGRKGVKSKPMKMPQELFNKEELEKFNMNIHRLLHPTLLRKLRQAFELKNIAEKIEYIKYRHGTEKVEKIKPGTPLQTSHYLDIYVKAMEVDKIPLYSPERFKEFRLYYGTIAGMPVVQYLENEYLKWREGFKRFSRLVEVRIPIPKVLSKIDLGFGEKNNPFSKHEDITDLFYKLGIPRTFLTGDIVRYSNEDIYEQMKQDQQKLEELLDLIKLCEYIRPEVLYSISNVYAYNYPTKDKREEYEKWIEEEPERNKAEHEARKEKMDQLAAFTFDNDLREATKDLKDEELDFDYLIDLMNDSIPLPEENEDIESYQKRLEENLENEDSLTSELDKDLDEDFDSENDTEKK